MTSRLTDEQIEQLLRPINTRRVLKDGKGFSHLSQQDVTAHLTRVFGFANWSTSNLKVDRLYLNEHPHTKNSSGTQWDCVYQATLRLTVCSQDGAELASYEDGSTGSAVNQPNAADALDLAMKSAISLAKKRCATALGDQFGLSLYNKGQTAALVVGIVGRGQVSPETHDVQAEVPQQEAMGIDETHYGDTDGNVEPTAEQRERLAATLGAQEAPS